MTTKLPFHVSHLVRHQKGKPELRIPFALGFAALMMMSSRPAHADGGRGGEATASAPRSGAAGGSLASPNGGDGVRLGSGGGGGAPGGTGGIGVATSRNPLIGGGGDGGAGGVHGWVGNALNTAGATGTAGVAGEIGEGGLDFFLGTSGDGGGGGAGGYGELIVGAGASVLASTADITGGGGGDGGGGGVTVLLGNAGNAGGGGDGGVALSYAGQSLVNAATLRGGAGGAGGRGGLCTTTGVGGNAGDAGLGGTALIFTGTSVQNFGALIGGRGGDGGTGENSHGDQNGSPFEVGYGGNGGNGGAAVILAGGTRPSFVNAPSGMILGGDGGAGGSSGAGDAVGSINGVVGISGVGGAGLVALTNSASIQNQSTIQGGTGGSTGENTLGTHAAAGAGGIGLSIVGNDNSVINTGSIHGGATGDRLGRASAIDVTGNFNTIQLYGGTSLSGDVIARGDGNVLELNDSGDIDSAITGMDQLLKSANGSWILRGVVSGTTQLTTNGGTLTFTADNIYTGGTTILGGTLQLGDGGTAGNVAGDIFNDGALSFMRSDNVVFAGKLMGTGSVTQQGTGIVTLTRNETYTGATTINTGTLALSGAGSIAASSGVQVQSAGTFDISGVTAGNVSVRNLTGSGIVDLGGNTLDLTDANGTFAGAINGAGGLIKRGAGVLTLTGANTYNGDTNIAAGGLRAGAANTFSASSAHTVATGATLDLAGFSQAVAGLTNNGTVSLLGPAPGATLTVTGAYVGNNALLRIGTTLGTDGSVSDRLILGGPTATASGHTTVQVTNIGGLGGVTTGNGIEVISAVHGATTTADAFTLANGHVVARAYEYRLYAKDAAGAGENWYLRDTTPGTPTGPTDPGNPTNPANPVNPGNPANPSNPGNPAAANNPGDAGGATNPTAPAGPINQTNPATPSLPATPSDVVPTYRGEVPLLAALPEQIRQAGLTMLGNLHERIGDDGMQADASGLDSERRSWGRVINSDLELRQSGAVAPDSSGPLSGFQVGTDIFTSRSWRSGAYLGQLDGKMHVDGLARGVTNLDVGHNDLRNRYLGIYGTYASEHGLYADAVVQAGRHRYTIDAHGSPSVEARGNSLLVSLEMGQSFMLFTHWAIEPQVQIVHQNIDMDDVWLTGARVPLDSDAGWLGRAGVRIKGAFTTDVGMLQPYARVNVYKASGGKDVARFIGPAGSTDIATRVGNTSTELAAGLTWSMTGKVNVFGEVGRLWSSSGERVSSPFKGSIGLRLQW